MLPAEPIVRAAARWMKLLRTWPISRAASLIRADATFTDLTQTQYAAALEWLRVINIAVDSPAGVTIASEIRDLSDGETHALLFERTVECAAPLWLVDADLLIPDTDALPQDVIQIAQGLKLTEAAALSAIRHVHGKVNIKERSELGSQGELALIELLERRWPGSTTHVAATDDGLGYDLVFRHGGTSWHLEVKSTRRRGRLALYLSRHEYEVSLRDPHWRLIAIGLDEEMTVRAVATVPSSELAKRAPSDACFESRWQSVSHELGAGEIEAGLSFIGVPVGDLCWSGEADSRREWGSFAWMPR
jgi:hypothetical protein